MIRSTLLPTVALLASLAPHARGQEIATIPLPSLCATTPPPPAPRALRDGAHIVLRVDGSSAPAKRAPFLAPPLLTKILEQQARQTESGLRVIPGDRPLLVAGSKEAIALAQETRQDLDEAGQRLDIQLEVQLFPGEYSSSEEPHSSPFVPGKPIWKSTVRSGEEAFFGTREKRPFLSTFDVEVSANAGAADPIVGHVYLGETLHLAAHRIQGGRRIHLTGVLDLSELLSEGEFDPDNLDLGKLQQPELASTVVMFSDVIRSGAVGQDVEDGTCFVSLRGLPLSVPNWNLLIRASTSVEPGAESGEASGWALLDLAFLSEESSELPQSAYAEEWEGASNSLPRAFPSWNANAVQGLLQSAAPGVLAPAAGRGLPFVTGKGLILLDRAAPKAREAAVQLVEAAEEARSYAGRLQVRTESSMAFDLPFTANQPLRIQCGIERVVLADYTVEIAPETWMPVPEVMSLFEGLQLDAGLAGRETLFCELRQRGVSEQDRQVGADMTDQGAVQWPRRTLSSTRILSRLGADAVTAFNNESTGEQENNKTSVSVRTARRR